MISSGVLNRVICKNSAVDLTLYKHQKKKKKIEGISEIWELCGTVLSVKDCFYSDNIA